MRYATDVLDLLKKAKKGDTVAQKQLGMLWSRADSTLGDGVSWLKKAAETDVDAAYMLGRIYVKRYNDARSALSWYENAAARGHVDAMIDVGAFYLFGFQVERSVSRAIQWYKRAASYDSGVAYHNLGFLCYLDDSLHETALNFFTKAASLGYADSAYMLGIMYLQGKGTEKNAAKALENLMLAVSLGKHYACRPIGDLYFQGAFDNGRQNPVKAIEWYLRGKDFGVLSCMEVLGDCYYHGFGVNVDQSAAHVFYKMAADNGSRDAAFALGTMYIGNGAIRKDLREALKWMLVAEKKGHPKAPHFVQMITDVLCSGTAAAAGGVANGGSVGIKLRSSYSAGAEALIAEQRARAEANKKRNAGIYAAAGAMSGSGSYVDYEMGAVISEDGEVSYVDTDLGIILGADGSVSSHDRESGLTYNWSTGGMMAYNEAFNATLDMNSGEVSYNYNGYTL